MLAETTKFGEGTVVITRVFDAPRELVWQAWTDPKMLAQWFGPRGFTSSVPEWDLRVGGALRIVMHGPDGNDYPMKGAFREVVKPERLVFSNIPVDKDGNRLMEGETIVTLSERDGKTTLTVKSHMVGLVPIAAQMLAGMEAGWTQSIDKLAEIVARGLTQSVHPRESGDPVQPPTTDSESPLAVDARRKSTRRHDSGFRSTATPPRPIARRLPTAPPRSSGCGAARRGRWLPPSPATAPGRRA